MARRDWYCENVLSGEMEVEIVWEDERVLAFHHPRPLAEIHVVVIPKEHVASILDSAALDGELLSSMVRAVQETAHRLVSVKKGSTSVPMLPPRGSRRTCIGTFEVHESPHTEADD